MTFRIDCLPVLISVCLLYNKFRWVSVTLYIDLLGLHSSSNINPYFNLYIFCFLPPLRRFINDHRMSSVFRWLAVAHPRAVLARFHELSFLQRSSCALAKVTSGCRPSGGCPTDICPRHVSVQQCKSPSPSVRLGRRVANRHAVFARFCVLNFRQCFYVALVGTTNSCQPTGSPLRMLMSCWRGSAH